MVGTVAAIERELLRDGLVLRYPADEEGVDVDGLPPGEGTFLPCSFWLAQVLALQGREAEASDLFERLLALRNDLGLLSEEYDTSRNASSATSRRRSRTSRWWTLPTRCRPGPRARSCTSVACRNPCVDRRMP